MSRPIDEAAWALHQQRLLIADLVEHSSSLATILDLSVHVEAALSDLLVEWPTHNPVQRHQTDRQALALDVQLDTQLCTIAELLETVESELGTVAALADQLNDVEAAAHLVLSENATRLRAL